MSDLYSTWAFGQRYFQIPILHDVGRLAGDLRRAGYTPEQVAAHFQAMEGVVELPHNPGHAQRLYGW